MLAVHLLDEYPYHHLRGVEVRNDSVTERTYCFDAGIHPFVHQFGFLAQGDAYPRIIVYSDDARLIKYYLVILENDGVRSTEIYRKFLSQKRKCHIQFVLLVVECFL